MVQIRTPTNEKLLTATIQQRCAASSHTQTHNKKCTGVATDCVLLIQHFCKYASQVHFQAFYCLVTVYWVLNASEYEGDLHPNTLPGAILHSVLQKTAC